MNYNMIYQINRFLLNASTGQAPKISATALARFSLSVSPETKNAPQANPQYAIIISIFSPLAAIEHGTTPGRK